MKIKLLVTVPVQKEYGLTKDRIIEVLDPSDVDYASKEYGWLVVGDNGKVIGILPKEAEIVQD